jgi:transposase, IS5 family
MLGKSPVQGQKDLFRPLLLDFIDHNHELMLLSEKIQWKELEKDFSVLFSHTGTPSKPIRLMSGLLILKQMYNLSDEGLIAAWTSNPYMQYFCGEACFQWQQPCDPSELVHFRKRIGVEGVEKILKQSVNLFSAALEKAEELIVDTTVQEKNITFPTDVKLQLKIAEKCNVIAEKEGITLRQSYSRTLKDLKLKLRFSHHPARRKEANKARKKIKTIAGRLVRDVMRKLKQEHLPLYQQQLDTFRQVLLQVKDSKDKIYSLHATEVACIAKGKPHKPYEFGCKVGIAMVKELNIIAGVASFTGNPHDSQTLEPTLKHVKEITGKTFKAAIVDRGYRGKKKIDDTLDFDTTNRKNFLTTSF